MYILHSHLECAKFTHIIHTHVYIIESCGKLLKYPCKNINFDSRLQPKITKREANIDSMLLCCDSASSVSREMNTALGNKAVNG